MIKRTMILTLGLSLLQGVFLAGETLADTIEWRMHSIFVTARQEAGHFEEFADRVEERTNGGFKITVYHGGALGLNDADLLRTLPGGAVEMAVVSPEYLSRDAPEIADLYFHGAILSSEEHKAVAPVLHEIFRENLEEKWGITVLGFYQFALGNNYVWCRREPVNSLEELRTKKLRVWSRSLVDTFAELGIPAQIVPQNELYVALQTGVVDCTVYPPALAPTISLQEVVNSGAFIWVGASNPFIMMANTAAWEDLSAEYREILTEEIERLHEVSWKAAFDTSAEQHGLGEVVEEGVTILDPFSAEDQEAFHRAAMAVSAANAERVGAEMMENRERMISAVEAVRQ